VTGAADGIGRALALAFAKEGAQVAGCSRSTEHLDSLEKEIKGSGHIFLQQIFPTPRGLVNFLTRRKKRSVE